MVSLNQVALLHPCRTVECQSEKNTEVQVRLHKRGFVEQEYEVARSLLLIPRTRCARFLELA